MRLDSVSSIKGKGRSDLLLPTQGSRIRFLYDYLYHYRGLELPQEEYADLYDLYRGPDNRSRLSRHVHDLVDYWGCDILRFGTKRIALVGEWSGRVYIDYTTAASAEATEQAGRLELAQGSTVL